MAIEHDIVRPWLCCKDCRRRYKEQVQEVKFKDGTLTAQLHDDKIDQILEVLWQ